MANRAGNAPRDRQDALAKGFDVDTHIYPWMAYKGPFPAV